MATFRVTGGVLEVEPVTSPGVPTHPIALPGDPWWGDPRPTHPIVIIPPGTVEPGPPLVPAHPIYLPVYPAHPIVIPPEAIAPGVPTHPIYIPVYPAHPIVIPPGAIDGVHPEHPIYLPPYIWGPTDPRPTPPIYLPMPPRPEEPPPGEGWDWVYSPVYGWVADPGPGGKPQPPHPASPPEGAPARARQP